MTYSNRGNSGFRGSERPAMFDAICAKCGVNCQVPFKPNGRKEVFCSKCFADKNGDRNARTSTSSFTARDNILDLETINTKLDKIIKLLTPMVTEASEAMTEKILEEIEVTSGKKIVTGKKRPIKKPA